jgi:hypothetical protein
MESDFFERITNASLLRHIDVPLKDFRGCLFILCEFNDVDVNKNVVLAVGNNFIDSGVGLVRAEVLFFAFVRVLEEKTIHSVSDFVDQLLVEVFCLLLLGFVISNLLVVFEGMFTSVFCFGFFSGELLGFF